MGISSGSDAHVLLDSQLCLPMQLLAKVHFRNDQQRANVLDSLPSTAETLCASSQRPDRAWPSPTQLFAGIWGSHLAKGRAISLCLSPKVNFKRIMCISMNLLKTLTQSLPFSRNTDSSESVAFFLLQSLLYFNVSF